MARYLVRIETVGKGVKAQWFERDFAADSSTRIPVEDLPALTAWLTSELATTEPEIETVPAPASPEPEAAPELARLGFTNPPRRGPGRPRKGETRSA